MGAIGLLLLLLGARLAEHRSLLARGRASPSRGSHRRLVVFRILITAFEEMVAPVIVSTSLGARGFRSARGRPPDRPPVR